MSKIDDTYEMLDNGPEATKKSRLLVLVLVFLLVGGISAYIISQQADLNRNIAVIGHALNKGAQNTPSQAPTAANNPAPNPPASAPITPVNATINFDEASAIITPNQLTKIQSFYNQIKAAPGTIEINGYTDDVGSDEEGLFLSKQRAEAASAALKNIDPSSKYKYVVNSFGENNPVGDNRTAEGRQQNRRVELKFIPGQ